MRKTDIKYVSKESRTAEMRMSRSPLSRSLACQPVRSFRDRSINGAKAVDGGLVGARGVQDRFEEGGTQAIHGEGRVGS